MHPAVVILPVLAVAFGPQLWAKRLLRRHDVDDDSFLPAHELARRLLDRNGLELVRVEVTDLADHYDPLAKTVRLSRAQFARCSLTAATTVAHEVGHALQDAAGYPPFRLHLVLARVSRVTGDVGTVLLISAPIAAIFAQGPMLGLIVGAAGLGMLGTSLAAQLAALPSELNASFSRAMPMLRECCIDDVQARAAGRILLACSLTYVSSSLNPLMVLWPWVGGPVRRPVPALRAARPLPACSSHRAFAAAVDPHARRIAGEAAGARKAAGFASSVPISKRDWPLLRVVARPFIRTWLRTTGRY